MSLWLVIITGASGTGKTSLGRRLAADLALPFVHKDRIKERLHDVLGTESLDASRLLGKASYGILFDFAETLLAARTSLIIESNFSPEYHNKPFTRLAAEYGCFLLQIYLYADGQILYRRIQQRRERGERHPAHHDILPPEDIAELSIRNIAPALNIPGTRIEVDTSDFTRMDYPALRDTVRELMSRAGTNEKHSHAKQDTEGGKPHDSPFEGAGNDMGDGADNAGDQE